MASARSVNKPAYSLTIPIPSLEEDTIKQLGQFITECDGTLCVYWNTATKQVIINQLKDWGTKDAWYIQPDGYITDSIGEILAVKESLIGIYNLRVGHSYDMSTFTFQDNDMTNNFYSCKWSDYACDHLIMQGNLKYPYL
jgi:hypothetical protein